MPSVHNNNGGGGVQANLTLSTESGQLATFDSQGRLLVRESQSVVEVFKNVVPEIANIPGNATGVFSTSFTPTESADYVFPYSGDLQSGTAGISVGTTEGGAELFSSNPASGDADGSRLTLTRQENFTPPIPLTAGAPYSITQWVGGGGHILDHTVCAELQGVEPAAEAIEAFAITANEEAVVLDGIEIRLSQAAAQAQIRATSGTIEIETSSSLQTNTATSAAFGTITLDQTWQNLLTSNATFTLAGSQERAHIKRTDTDQSYQVDTRIGVGWNNNSIIIRRLGQKTAISADATLPLTPLTRTTDFDLSGVTLDSGGTTLVTGTPATGQVSIDSGSINRVGTRGELTFNLNVSEDDPFTLDFANALPTGASFYSVVASYPSIATDADTDLFDATITGGTLLSFNRRDSQNGLFTIPVTVGVRGLDNLEEFNIAAGIDTLDTTGFESVRDAVLGNYGRGTPTSGTSAPNGQQRSVPLTNVGTAGDITYDAVNNGFVIPDGTAVEINGTTNPQSASQRTINIINSTTSISSVPNLTQVNASDIRIYQGVYENDTGGDVIIGMGVSGGGNTGNSNTTGYLMVRKIN